MGGRLQRREALRIGGLALGGVALAAGRSTPSLARAGAYAPGAQVAAPSLVEGIVATWPEKPQNVARETIDKYGLPQEATVSVLIWHNNGPWKRTMLYRDEVPHLFPKPHTDLLEQFIDYRVPPEKFSELAAYDGSVIVERTKGEISARCDMEAMNFLALNLANDIVSGRSTVEQARQAYTEIVMAFMMNRPAPYTEGLQFLVAGGGMGDPDVTTVPGM
jgi:hypothetical protein